MLLVIVSDLNFCSQGKGSGVCRLHLIEDLKERGLSGAVIANDRDMFPSFDLKADILKENLAVKLFGEPFHRENVIPADAGRL